VRTVAELLHDYQHVIEEIRVVTGSSGVFDLHVDGDVIFSKKQVGRHAEPGEILRRFREHLGPEVATYERG
jgi:selenoprotein W-related protein